MSILLSLLDHVIWADSRAHAEIAGIDAARVERAQATRLYAHLAAAEHVWLARLEGRAPAHAIWPELSLEAAAALATESLAELRAIAAGDSHALAREVEYRNSAGQAFRNTVADILAHVALHGSYHRGQLALLARQGGGTPVATDYIVFVRGVAAPAASSADSIDSPR
jgi:uncharacterized damage-inducible protein DinB